MAQNIYISFDSPGSLGLYLTPLNRGDDYLYFQVNASGVNKNILDSERLRIAIVPHNTVVHDDMVTYLNSSKLVDKPVSGIYGYEFTSISNTTYDSLNPVISIPHYQWENRLYDVYWQINYGSTSTVYSNTSGVYSNTRNIKSDWVTVSANFSNESYIDYKIYCSGINNEGGVYENKGPYALKVSYSPYNSTNPLVKAKVGGEDYTFPNDYVFYASGYNASGIAFSLPYFMPDNVTPATYVFNIAYNGLNGKICTPVSPVISHKNFTNNYLRKLESHVSNNVDETKLKYVGDIKIPKEYNPFRKRLSIGIQDISVNQNNYNKSGTFISNQKAISFNIYTFTLRSDEFIPNYTGIDPYTVIKYYVDFGNGTWLQVSPNNRSIEYNSEGIIPKLVVFDQQPLNFDSTQPVIYMPYENINSYRIKIVFDITAIGDQNIIPPEVREYKCLVSDRNKRFINEV